MMTNVSMNAFIASLLKSKVNLHWMVERWRCSALKAMDEGDEAAAVEDELTLFVVLKTCLALGFGFEHGPV